MNKIIRTLFFIPFTIIFIYLLMQFRDFANNLGHDHSDSVATTGQSVEPDPTDGQQISVAGVQGTGVDPVDQQSMLDDQSVPETNCVSAKPEATAELRPTGPATNTDQIDGTWRVVSIRKNGLPEETANDKRYDFRDGRLTVITANLPSADLAYKIDQSVSPCHLDLTFRSPRGTEVSRMIYQIDANALTIAYPKPGGARPDKFDSTPGAMLTLIQMERVGTNALLAVNADPTQKNSHAEAAAAAAETTTVAVARGTESDSDQIESAEPTSDSQAEANTWKVGQLIFGNWTGDRYWYPATIVKQDGERYFVRYFDDDEEYLTKDRMLEEKIKVGDRVFANWKQAGTYYSVKVTGREGDGIHVVYNDGDEEDTTINMLRIRPAADSETSRNFAYRPATRPRTYRRPTGPSFSDQLRSYQLQQQANAYRRQAQQMRGEAIRRAHEDAARDMRRYQNQMRRW